MATASTSAFQRAKAASRGVRSVPLASIQEKWVRLDPRTDRKRQLKRPLTREKSKYVAGDGSRLMVGDRIEFRSSEPGRQWKPATVAQLMNRNQKSRGLYVRIQVGPAVFLIRPVKACRLVRCVDV
jgi:hypothetical protein